VAGSSQNLSEQPQERSRRRPHSLGIWRASIRNCSNRSPAQCSGQADLSILRAREALVAARTQRRSIRLDRALATRLLSSNDLPLTKGAAIRIGVAAETWTPSAVGRIF
jgi:hypothetical protein